MGYTPAGHGGSRRVPSTSNVSTRGSRAKAPSEPSSDSSAMSSPELSPAPDNPATPAIVKRAAKTISNQDSAIGASGVASRRLQAALATAQDRERGSNEDPAHKEDEAQEGSSKESPAEGMVEQQPGQLKTATLVELLSPSLSPTVTPRAPTFTTGIPGKTQRSSKITVDRALPVAQQESSDDESDSSVEKTDETPLFDDALPVSIKSNGHARIKVTINPKQPLFVDLPEGKEGTTAEHSAEDTDIYTYPPSCIPLKHLSESLQQIKLARFLACRTGGCNCAGLKPPGWRQDDENSEPAASGTRNSRIVLWVDPSLGGLKSDPPNTAVEIEGLEALDSSARNFEQERLWEACGACGCGWRSGGVNVGERVATGGHTLTLTMDDVDMTDSLQPPNQVDKDELQRRRRVAHRAEEMLETVPGKTTQKQTGKGLKRTREDRDRSESIPNSAGVESFPKDQGAGVPEKTADRVGEEEDDVDADGDDEDDDDEADSKRPRLSNTGKRGPAGRVPQKTKADTAGGAEGGHGAGKQAASKSREPISIVRKIDGDTIVDEEGNVLDKRANPDEEIEVDDTVDGTVDVDKETDTPLTETFLNEAENSLKQQEEAILVDNLTQGVTIDMDVDRTMEGLDVDSLDNVEDWADIDFANNKHYSMAIVKRGWRVVGGICYRPFESRNFAEIVFCAVESTEQIRGYGSFLMNQVKDHVRQAHPTITHFLTYADNYAIGYFKKQGFSKEITFPRERWVGYIKDYDSANLMMCKMVPRVKYADVHQMLADQKAAVLAKIQTISQSHVVRPGLAIFKNRKPGEKIELAKEDIPGLVDSGWDARMDELLRTSIRPPQYVLFQQILNDLVDDANAWPFTKPVDRTVVKDYYDVITVPMDFQTMELKLESNHYKDLEEFTRDVKLIVANCKQYNGHSNDNSYTKAANALEKAFSKILIKRTAQITGSAIDKKDKKDKK
ncbi:hypothetical protein QFC22_003528 [Naganishia vaughanmartiniae]|uniref:Uncharacterized protein n=1 Tax=Naganishia vaughanmartiniae TaxID=1424756 RepID=A0ACC2X704_9TREE|nr:hypothetical protein QFC22_003528 [Naganishia vaughanmartiniae]